MKKKGKLRILSWITVIAMMLSIFNIPVLGYANETSGDETAAVQEVLVDEICEECGESPCICEVADVRCAECGEPIEVCECIANNEPEEIIGPSYEIIYYVDGEEQVYSSTYMDGDTYNYAPLPYNCDVDAGITVKVIHLDGTEEILDFNWESENYGYDTFTSVVNGEENEFTLEICVEEASSSTYCDLSLRAYNEDGDAKYIYIDSDEARSEEGATVVFPYGYTASGKLCFYVENGSVDLEGLDDAELLPEEEEAKFVYVNVGDTRTFTATAQNGDMATYTLNFVASDGSSADVDAWINIADSAISDEEMEEGDVGYRTIDIEFTEDETGNKTAQVVLPYGYLDDRGIYLSLASNDTYSTTFDGEAIYLGEDDQATVEFDVTSGNGEVTKSYKIDFTRESEEAGNEISFKTFTVKYMNPDGDIETLNVDPADASDEDGAAFAIPEGYISKDMDEYYVDINVAIDGYGELYNWDTNADSYNSNCDSNYINYSIDLRWQNQATLVFNGMPSSGNNEKTYKIKLIDEARINDPEIDEVYVEYTRIGQEDTTKEYVWLDNGTKSGDVTLYPYDDTKAITLGGEGADGSEISVPVEFKDGENETVVTFTSTSPNGKQDAIYTVKVMKPIHPLVKIAYEVEDSLYEEEAYFNDNCKFDLNLPYSFSIDQDITFDITLVDGTKLEDVPEIIWEKTTREDEHESLYGALQFEASGKTYTIDVTVDGISSNADAYMSLEAWDGITTDEDGEPEYKYVYEDTLYTEENEFTVVIPYGAEDNAYFYVHPDSEYGYVEEYEAKVAPGETRVYTITAQDGTTKEVKVNFVAADGTATEAYVDAFMYFIDQNNGQGGCYQELTFEEQDGVMVADLDLHYCYDESEGVKLDVSADDYVTFDKDFDKRFYPDADSASTIEFTVTSPNGMVKQPYKINVAKESEEEANGTDLAYVDLMYVDKDGKDIETEVDLTAEKDGKITVSVPEDMSFNEYVTLIVYNEGYSYTSKGPGEYMGFGDYGMFGISFKLKKDEPKVVTFEVTSSNGKNTKEYTITIKAEEQHDCVWGAGIITTEPTCTAEGVRTYTCAICGETKTESVDPIKHTYKKTVTAPTCTKEGFTTYKCKCGDSYVDNKVPAKGHSYSVVKTVKATTDKDGYRLKRCSACGDEVKDTINKIASIKLSKTTYVYNGYSQKPKVTVTDSEGNTINPKYYYTVTYSKGRAAVGRYKAVVTFKTRYSGTKTLYFNIVPKAPASASATLYGHDDVKFSWSKSKGATGYTVYFKKADAEKYTLLTRTTGTSVKKAGLTDGIKYRFKVVPYFKKDGVRYGTTYKTASVYTLKKLDAPVITNASETSVKLAWTDIDGQSGYQISRSAYKSKTNIVSTFATTATASRTLKATKGKTYYYKVRAYKTVGKTKIYGPWSEVTKYKLQPAVQ